MYEVELLNLKINKEFKKVFWSKLSLDRFIKKVMRSSDLKLLCITDNRFFYD